MLELVISKRISSNVAAEDRLQKLRQRLYDDMPVSRPRCTSKDPKSVLIEQTVNHITPPQIPY